MAVCDIFLEFRTSPLRNIDFAIQIQEPTKETVKRKIQVPFLDENTGDVRFEMKEIEETMPVYETKSTEVRTPSGGVRQEQTRVPVMVSRTIKVPRVIMVPRVIWVDDDGGVLSVLISIIFR